MTEATEPPNTLFDLYVGDTESLQPDNAPKEDGTYAKAKGGTEAMAKRIGDVVSFLGLDDQVNIIHSRVSNVDPSKKNVLVLHDLWSDPEATHLREKESLDRFEKIVFVSNQQQQTYHLAHGVPYSKSAVMKNAITPIDVDIQDKPDNRINIIYHTTPHRGLDLLVPAFVILAEHHKDIHLHVYSSFDIYGWGHRDEPYKHLFDRVKNHPNMTYYGFQPNETVREALKEAHIFAYPNIWQETSCIAAMEAMSAGCDIVCPNYAALPETTAGFASEYQYHEDPQEHVNTFIAKLHQSIVKIRRPSTLKRLENAKSYADTMYNWDFRKKEWANLLTKITNS